MKLKICGLVKNLVEISELKPDMMGFIFYPPSPRYALSRVQPIELAQLPKDIQKVGVFVNATLGEIKNRVQIFGLNVVQLHGDEPPNVITELQQYGVKVIKVFRVEKQEDFAEMHKYQEADYFLFDTRSTKYGGSGMGMEGLKLFYKICRENGIKIITEVMQVSQVEDMLPYVDIFQVGARNAQNFNLLDALGQVDKAVLLKRGISGSIEELLYSAEYVFSAGNEKIMLCERGIRTFEQAYRNTLDLNAIPILKEKTHLPVIADPSHGIGIRQHVSPMALAAVAAGADGMLLEMHQTPEKAASDGQQTLNYTEFEQLVSKMRQIHEIIH